MTNHYPTEQDAQMKADERQQIKKLKENRAMGHSNCDRCGHDKKHCECSDTFVAQEGGSHYQTEGIDYQHWDWVQDIGMGYLPGNATKYVSRWQKKNGIADLKKAMTYIDKMIAIRKVDPAAPFSYHAKGTYAAGLCTERFVKANKLGDLERSICEVLSHKCEDAMIAIAKRHLQTLITVAQRVLEAAERAKGAGAPATSPMTSSDQKTALPGPVAGAMVQAPATNTSVERHEKAVDGMEHPFGYDEWHEGDMFRFRSTREQKE